MREPRHFRTTIKTVKARADKTQGFGVAGRSVFVDAMGKLMTAAYWPLNAIVGEEKAKRQVA